MALLDVGIAVLSGIANIAGDVCGVWPAGHGNLSTIAGGLIAGPGLDRFGAAGAYSTTWAAIGIASSDERSSALMTIASLTSSISMLEVPVAYSRRE